MNEALAFFIEDLIRITLLLFTLIAIIATLRTYISRERTKKLLAKGGPANYLAASGLGAITPFCTCSSIPLFIGMLEAGVPLGVTFTFLTTSPLINELVIVLMLGFFGWKVTLIYIAAGAGIGIIAGVIMSRMDLDHHIELDDIHGKDEQTYTTFRQRAKHGTGEAWNITKKIFPWLIVGIGLGAVIHNYVPQQLIEGIMMTLGPFSVPISAALGVPMYGNGAAIIPIATQLFEKGVPLGTALAFMMSVVGLSLPEAVILRKVMSLRLIGIFFGIVATGIVLIGFALNAI